MGIILKPKPGSKPLTAKQIVERLIGAGIHSRLDHGSWIVLEDPSLHEADALSFKDDRLWIGQCYPTDQDPLSLLVMRVAKLIDYDTEGE